jgi:hypothetical protein
MAKKVGFWGHFIFKSIWVFQLLLAIAYFFSAYFSSAYFSSAYKTSAYFLGAYFLCAYFFSAYFSSAHFLGAYFSSAYFSSAYFLGVGPRLRACGQAKPRKRRRQKGFGQKPQGGRGLGVRPPVEGEAFLGVRGQPRPSKLLPWPNPRNGHRRGRRALVEGRVWGQPRAKPWASKLLPWPQPQGVRRFDERKALCVFRGSTGVWPSWAHCVSRPEMVLTEGVWADGQQHNAMAIGVAFMAA